MSHLHRTCPQGSKQDEDSITPNWYNQIQGQVNLSAAYERTLQFNTKVKEYRLNDGELATLIVRPRGWHLEEKNILILEAMKMESDVKSPQFGVIQTIHVQAGDTVQSGDALLSLKV